MVVPGSSRISFPARRHHGAGASDDSAYRRPLAAAGDAADDGPHARADIPFFTSLFVLASASRVIRAVWIDTTRRAR